MKFQTSKEIEKEAEEEKEPNLDSRQYGDRVRKWVDKNQNENILKKRLAKIKQNEEELAAIRAAKLLKIENMKKEKDKLRIDKEMRDNRLR